MLRWGEAGLGEWLQQARRWREGCQGGSGSQVRDKPNQRRLYNS